MTTDSLLHPLATDRPGKAVRMLRARLIAAAAADADTNGIRLDLGRALFAQGRNQEAAHELQGLLAEKSLDPGQIAAAQAVLAGAHVLSGRPADGRVAAEAVLRSAAADQESQVLARSALRGLEFFAGSYERALLQARQIFEIGSRSGAVGRAEARIDLGGMLVHVDEFDEAELWLSPEADAPDHAREEASQLLGLMNLFRGGWKTVLDLVPSATSTTGQADRSDASRVTAPGIRAHALIHLDRLEEARRELATVLPATEPPTNLVARSLIAEADGDVQMAAAEAERAVARVAEARFAPQLRMWAIDLTRIALAAEDVGTATRAVHGMESAARATRVRSVHATAAAIRGMVERDPAIVRRGVEILAAGPRRVAHGQALEALAGIHAQMGAASEAVAALRAALGLWGKMSANRDIRRVRRALADHGVRTRPSAPRDTLKSPSTLSTTESTVADLIAEGLTNAQIASRLLMSRRTAETHVAHVLAKLDVPTRAAAARVVVEKGQRR